MKSFKQEKDMFRFPFYNLHRAVKKQRLEDKNESGVKQVSYCNSLGKKYGRHELEQ